MNAFGYLPTLACCLLILITAGLLGYRVMIDALDGWVRDAEPDWDDQSWPCRCLDCLDNVDSHDEAA